MKGYKALNNDMCAIYGNGMQYELNKEYTLDGELEICKNGFHFCKKLINVYEIYNDIKTLSDGAEEMRRLGSILSLNQGIKTNSEGLLNQINLIERAIYDITGNQEDLINLQKFVFDEQYRKQCIDKYEEYKHTFNILDVVATVPHFMGYLQTLAISDAEAEASSKFRSITQL